MCQMRPQANPLLLLVERPVVGMKTLIQALWSLREDAIFAHSQALNGQQPNLVTLDVSYQNVVKAVIAMDNEK